MKITMRYLSFTNETKMRVVNVIGDILIKSRTDIELIQKAGNQSEVITPCETTSPQGESNPQPRHYECRALPLSYTG